MKPTQLELRQLKRAFWEVFFQAGDLYFGESPIIDDPLPPIAESQTEYYFREFLAALTGDRDWTHAYWNEEGRSVSIHSLEFEEGNDAV